MADKKISELTAATTLGVTDVFPVTQSGVTKKVSFEVIRDSFGTSFTEISSDAANISDLVVTNISWNLMTLAGTPQEVDTTDTVDLTTSITKCTNSLGVPYDLTLPAGTDGLIHVVFFQALQVSLLATGMNWTSITPTASTASVVLLYSGTSWYILSSNQVNIT